MEHAALDGYAAAAMLTTFRFLSPSRARLSEAITLIVDNVRLAESFAYLPTSKNGEPRAVFLPKIVKRALRT